jgi:DNA-binding protein H-NS
MSKTYSQLMKQIDSLQREAEDIRRKEIAGVIDRIKEAISAYGLTAADLGLAGARAPKAVKRKKAAARPGRRPSKSARSPKYRDDAGNTWGGRGPRPAWLREALAAGKQLADFAVK